VREELELSLKRGEPPEGKNTRDFDGLSGPEGSIGLSAKIINGVFAAPDGALGLNRALKPPKLLK